MRWVKALPPASDHWLLSRGLELPVPRLRRAPAPLHCPHHTAVLSLPASPSGLELRVLGSWIPGAQEGGGGWSSGDPLCPDGAGSSSSCPMGCWWDRQRPVSLSQHLKLLKEGFPDIHPHCILTFYFLNIKVSRSLITYVTQIRTRTLLPTQCQGPGSDRPKKGLLEAGLPKSYLPSSQRSVV